MEEDKGQPPIDKGRAMKNMRITLIVLVIGLLALASACAIDGEPTPTPTPTPTPSPTPLVTMSCEIARDSIQVALDAYHAEYGEWPTADSQPGDIDWDKLVPAFMDITPSNDSRCDWRVNSDPEGEVCALHTC